jgi:hypothetical protein
MGESISNPSYVESLWVHSPPLGAKYQPGLAPWVHTFDLQLDVSGMAFVHQPVWNHGTTDCIN